MPNIVIERDGEYVPSALASQLLAAGVECLGVTCTQDATGAVTAVQVIVAAGVSSSDVDAVVAAYSDPPPPPPPAPPVPEKVANALEQLKQQSGGNPITADQLAPVISALTT